MLDVVEDTLMAGGLRQTRWAADAPLEFVDVENGYQVRTWEDALLGLHYAELSVQYRGPVEVFFQELGPKKFMRVLAWAIQGEKVSQCMADGAVAFASMTGRWPRFALMAKLPKGVERCVEVEGVALDEADWAVPGFVFIGG